MRTFVSQPMLAAAAAASALLLLPIAFAADDNATTAGVVPVDYDHDGAELQGFKALPAADDSGNATTALKPAVVIIPDWDGVNDYEKLRAAMIAEEWGYVGFAADIYGKDLHTVDNMTQRVELATLYRSGDPELFANRIQAAVDVVRTFPEVDGDRIALAGYCFGGTGVLTYGLLGLNDVEAIVSFHGGLSSIIPSAGGGGPGGGPAVTPQILVLSGGEDDASTDVMDLERTLDAANATWEITRYSDVEHAFTKFDDDRYDEWADMRSWDRTRQFLAEVFGEDEALLKPTGPPDEVQVEAVPYVDVDGAQMQGYVSSPDESKWATPSPVVVILPDWDGVNDYEKARAVALSELGYVGFAADVYGADLQDADALSFEERGALTSMYRANETLFVQRIERAIEVASSLPGADPDNVAVIGYCFGGTGVIYLAFSDSDKAKVVVSFHGGLRQLPDVGDVPAATPYVLVLSGGADDAHGNQTVLEEALDGIDADWEITRYSGVVHGFTKWDSENAYSLMADVRSWDSMLSAFEELLDGPTSVGEQSDASLAPSMGEQSNSVASLAPSMGVLLSAVVSYCLFL